MNIHGISGTINNEVLFGPYLLLYYHLLIDGLIYRLVS